MPWVQGLRQITGEVRELGYLKDWWEDDEGYLNEVYEPHTWVYVKSKEYGIAWWLMFKNSGDVVGLEVISQNTVIVKKKINQTSVASHKGSVLQGRF